ncbi:MAG: hypothetical protein ABIJ14_00765 [Nanoarchaeota archaeon]|nr:hypothetical protein [Nanoarchaeota archaeon]
MKKYFEKIRNYLWDKDIRPIFKRVNACSLDRIIGGMKPIPIEDIKDKLPHKSAYAIRLITSS